MLGLRFVKRTVNFDDPSVYHLYYGNEIGAPGTAMTFFPWEHLAPARRGTGEVALTAFSVPDGSLEFWRERLSRLGVPHHEPEPRFGEPALAHDRSRRPAARAGRGRARSARPWTTPEIDAEHAVRGFHGVCLTLDDRAATAELLTEVMGYERVASADGVHRYAAPYAATARYVDIVEAPTARRRRAGAAPCITSRSRSPTTMPRTGSGERLIEAGHRVTPRIDRTYFHFDLLPHAGRRAVRDRHRRAGLHRRRAAREPRAGAEAAAAARAPRGLRR